MKSRHLVEPEALVLIEAAPPRGPLSLDALPEMRRNQKQLVDEALALRSEMQTAAPITQWAATAPGVEGGPDVPLLVFAPQGTTPRGALLHIHGGGFVLGFAAMDAPLCESMAATAQCVVVAVDYRLAPETPHPGPINDCYAALLWLWGEANALGVDRARIGVHGGSAGGGLAAAVVLLARDRGEVPLCFQCLTFPMLDDRTAATTDPNPFTGEFGWTPADNAFGWSALLGHAPGLPGVSPYASPSRATDLSGLPPTFLSIGALDLFVDECVEYARRLIRSGVPTEFHIYPGMTHVNAAYAPSAPRSVQASDDVARAIERAMA
jgi:triacylglycerol lipase